MNGATVAELLADLIGPAANVDAQPTPANSAKAAKGRASFGAAADSGVSEGLRISAKPASEPVAPSHDSQVFAGIRNPLILAPSKQPCDSSQLSHTSQGWASANASGRPNRLSQADGDAAHAELWNEAACARFVARMSLFLRRGIDATDADDLAERLHLRDVQADDRHLCLECAHLVGRATTGRTCGNANAARLGRELPAAILVVLQRCPGFSGVTN